MGARIRDVVEGVRLVGAGFRVWQSSPRLMLLGLIPGVIASLLLGGLFVAIAVWVDDWAEGIVGSFTNDPTPNSVLVAIVALAIVGAGVLLSVFVFTALTLLIGQPFFERIANRVAGAVGLEFTGEQESLWRSTWRGLCEGTRLLTFGIAFGFAMFLVGLVPAVGAAFAFVGSALVGGTLLSLELTAYPLSRVGVVRLADRRRIVRARRPLTLGFGVTAYVLCLVPLGAVISMPALVAGGTMLSARLAPTQSLSRADVA